MKRLVAKICALWNDSEVIRYIFFGGLTTLVSWLAKFLWNLIFYKNTKYPTSVQNFILSIVCWVAGVIFAFITNRKYVFEKSEDGFVKELSKFVLSRVSTLVLDIIIMQILGNVLGINVFVATMIAEVIVVAANYGLSKYFVFKNEK